MNVNASTSALQPNLLRPLLEPGSPESLQRQKAAKADRFGSGQPPLGAPLATTPRVGTGVIDPATIASDLGNGIGNAAPAGTETAPLTVDGLMERWGQRDAEYDLDGDGVVGMGDLIALLSRNQNGDPGAPPAGTPIGDRLPDIGIGGPDEGGAASPQPMLTVDGLMERWGQRDADYDLDGDGVVGMGDLVALLARENAGTNGTPKTDDGAPLGTTEPAAPGLGIEAPNVGDPASPQPMLTVDGLMERWGQRDAEYDLDGDGVVGMGDLVALLAREGDRSGDTPRVADGAPIGTAEEVAPGLVAGAPGSDLTVEELMKRWGERNAEYDLDGDGVVGMGDLIALLDRMGGSREPGTGGERGTDPMQYAGSGDRLDSDPRALVDRLVESFRDRGFLSGPPENLHAIVKGLGLDGADSRNVLRGIQAAYPQGLGVSLRA